MPFELPAGGQYLIYGAIFLSVMLLVEGLFVMLGDRRRFGSGVVNRRLRVQAKTGEGQAALAELRRPSDRQYPFPLDRLDQVGRQAGVRSSPWRIAMWMGLLGVFGAVLLAITGLLPVFVALPVGAAAGIGLPLVVLIRRRGRRAQQFLEQLPDALDTVARSLRAGHPFTAALALAAGELSDPMGSELGITADEMTYGMDLQDALNNLRQRVNVPDLDYLIVSVVVQRQTGGNLAEILKNLSSVIRDRFRMKKKVRALSAEGRLSAWVISIMPFFVGGALRLIKPDYYSKYAGDPALWYMMGFGLVILLLGIAVMYRVVNFRF